MKGKRTLARIETVIVYLEKDYGKLGEVPIYVLADAVRWVDKQFGTFTKYSLLLNSVFATTKIERLYVLGDSISDSGGLVEHLKDPTTYKKFFPSGKLTDSELWVETLKSQLHVIDYQNYAVTGATSDNATFPDAKGIPGCFQQANRLIEYLNGKENIERDSTLVTMLFFGNDFFLGSNTEVFVSNMRKCLDMVAATNLVGHIFITSSVGTEYSPYKKQSLKEIVELGKASTLRWKQELTAINRQINNTKIYDLDFKSIVETAIKNNKSKEPCFNLSLLALPTEVPAVCENPSSHIFYDQFHPTSYIHGLMAEKAVRMLGL